MPGLQQHCPLCTPTWEASLARFFPKPPLVLFQFHLRNGLSPGPDWAIFTPKGLCFPISGPDDKAPCPWTEAFPWPELGCRARPKASALSETKEGSGTRLRGKKDALTLLKAAVDLLVLQQLLAVVLKRLISRVRHDEKPSLIGDAGNGHGRPGGGKGRGKGEEPPWKRRVCGRSRPFRLAPPLYSTSPTTASSFT